LKSISAEQTLGRGESDARRLWGMLREMAQDVAHRLQHQGLVARTIGIKLRLADWHLVTRDRTLPQPIDDGPRIATAAAALMRAHWRRGTSLRLLGLRATNLSLRSAAAQLALFPEISR
jgi:DNA polymerase-4